MRNLAREMNLITLQNEAALGEERPAGPPAVERLAKIRAPVLVVAGELDRPGVNARAHLLARSIAHAQKVIMNETTHVPNMENPEEVNRVVLGFLGGVAA